MSWEAVEDDQGRTYYYNRETQETSWTNPEIESASWKVYQNDDGREYYYNETTQETTWEMPEELKEEVGKAGNDGDGNTVDAQVSKDAETEIETGRVVDVDGDEQEDAQIELEGKENVAENYEKAFTSKEEPHDLNRVHELHSEALSSVDDELSNIDVPALPEPPSYSSLEEAQAAFKGLLKSSNVDSTWSFQRVISEHITNPIYWAISDALQRKELYDEYLIDIIKNGLANKTNVMEEFESNFTELLTTFQSQGILMFNTRWISIKQKLISEDNSLYKHSILTDSEMAELYHKFVDRLKAKHDEEVERQKTQALTELESYLVDINPRLVSDSSDWEELFTKLLKDSRFKANKHFNVLHPVDILKLYKTKIYPQTLKKLETQISIEERKNYRTDRKSRKQFKKFLVEKVSIRSNTLFKDIFAELENEDSFIEICGRNGSSPLELFWDIVDEKRQVMKLKKDLIENELKRRSGKVDYIHALSSKANFTEVFDNEIRDVNETIKTLGEQEVEEVYESLHKDLQYQLGIYAKNRALAIKSCGAWLSKEYLHKSDTLLKVGSEIVPGHINVAEKSGSFVLSEPIEPEVLAAFVAQVENSHTYRNLFQLIRSNEQKNQHVIELDAATRETLAALVKALNEQRAQKLLQEERNVHENSKKRSIEDSQPDDRPKKQQKHVLLNY
ncbi:pre-mRNA-processing protein Prp40p [[Candida] railenensis]|uniref:Pre-mRNA-processing protein Prp40p n=1 Tax=[Candida] railenensis TaxID=45579 RepID=A0A9P0QQQ3_9ASCO|nr:pre-mRNA-processing protein Prp40p [[Candida] railenensis]